MHKSHNKAHRSPSREYVYLTYPDIAILLATKSILGEVSKPSDPYIRDENIRRKGLTLSGEPEPSYQKEVGLAWYVRRR